MPDGIDVARHQQLRGRGWHVWVRRGLVAALAAIPLLALLDTFGQRPHATAASNPAATLTVDAPDRLRGGLIFTARFTIDAHRTLRRPSLVLGPGWVEDMQLNTVTPAPESEGSGARGVVYRYPTIPAGSSLVVYAELQVNPTSVGRHSQAVALEAGGRPLLAVDRTVTVLP